MGLISVKGKYAFMDCMIENNTFTIHSLAEKMMDTRDVTHWGMLVSKDVDFQQMRYKAYSSKVALYITMNHYP